MDERELPTNKIHDYVTWPTTTPIFDDGRGGLAFPEQNNSNCHVDEDGNLVSDEGKPVGITLRSGINYVDGDPISVSDIVYSPSYDVRIEADRINLRVQSFTFSSGHGTLILMDEVPSEFVCSGAQLVPITPDTLECTNLPTASITNLNISGNTVTFDSTIKVNGEEVPYDWPTDVSFDLVVTLVLSSNLYIYLGHQLDSDENGVYCYSSGNVVKVAYAPVDGTDVQSILTDSTVNDNVECCAHYRKSYSHREVYDRVNDLVGDVTKFGVKSMSISDCDGGLIDWFTSNGMVNIGNGHSSVFVTGFGLGNMYKASVVPVSSDDKLPKDDYDENDGVRHPWLEWAYGTKTDSVTPGGDPALPLDWPFTNLTGTNVFNQVDDTSNITLVKSNLETTRFTLDTDTGEMSSENVFFNRHHIVLYPDYSGDSNGNVVVKPLFIHLPASLDTKDGETIDITLSIQNVDQNAFGDGSAKALSGYYAAMSQPRVYVMGGSQKFSNKKLPLTFISESDDYYTMSSTRPAYANDGTTLLAADTEVRANIVVMDKDATGRRRTVVAHGTIVSNNQDDGVTFQFSGKFYYARRIQDKIFTICGMAYLDSGDNPTDVPMGILSRDENVLRPDSGSATALNAFNTFYGLTSDKSGVINMPHMDKRYVLATVYQTATNNFPWALTGRRRMNQIDRSWTDEFHRDRGTSKSLMHLIYEENRKLFDMADQVSSKTYKSSNEMLSYRTNYGDWKSLGSRVYTTFSSNFQEPETQFFGNPVRTAREAVKRLANDFRLMRLVSYTGSKKARVRVTGLSLAAQTWPSGGAQLTSTIVSPSSTYSDSWERDLVDSIWCSKLRNLPDYISNPVKTTLPKIFDNVAWYQYIADAPYDCDGHESSAAIETLPYSATGECKAFSNNSVFELVNGRLFAPNTNAEVYEDIRRYAETVLAIKISESEYMTTGDLTGIKDWMNPFTNIQSLDSVPYPNVSRSILEALSDDQHEFASADAVQMYRYEYVDSNDTIEDVSTVMPTETDLARFLETYVATYGAGMPLHQYQGTRVLLNNGEFPSSDDPIYIRTIDRVRKRWTDSSDLIDNYINDSFAVIGSDTRDSNVDRLHIGNNTSVGVSAPPYVEPKDVANQTYTRVMMQFTFSQKAGRWYTTDYRQYPTNYLSPLYGNKALSTTWKSMFTEAGELVMEKDEATHTVTFPEERRLWRNAACEGFNSYRSHMYFPYTAVPPMDITLGCVPFLTQGKQCVYDFSENWDGKLLDQYKSSDSSNMRPLSVLEEPYKPEDEGGINLYPPADIDGGYHAATDNGVHANFWSVRKYIRPAVSVLDGTDIPSVTEHTGGRISDPTLYRMFDFPVAGEINYKLPDVNNPDGTSSAFILYSDGTENGLGLINSNTAGIALGYAVSEAAPQNSPT